MWTRAGELEPSALARFRLELGNSVLLLSFDLNLGAWLKAFWPKRAPAKAWEPDLT